MHYRYVLDLANIIFSEQTGKEKKKYSTLFWCQAFKLHAIALCPSLFFAACFSSKELLIM